MKKFFKQFIGNWWIVRKSIWPYREGYSVYNAWRKMSVDHGISKKQAEDTCRSLNEKGI